MSKLRIKPSMIIALVYLIIAIPMTVMAKNAPYDPTYGMTLYVTFSDTTEIDEHIYHSNQFYCQTPDGQYIIADYYETEHAYVFEKFTTNKNLATTFIGGKDHENAKAIKITDFPAGEYQFIQTKVAEGYDMLTDPIKIIFDDTKTTINGTTVSLSDDNMISFEIHMMTAQPLPQPEPSRHVIDFLKDAAFIFLLFLIPVVPVIAMTIPLRRKKKTKHSRK